MNIDVESDGESSNSNENQNLDQFEAYEVDHSVDAHEVDHSMDDQPEEVIDETTVNTERTFDLTLPALHTYLGQNLEELRGRTILDDGIYMNLPLLVNQSLSLFPGQTLPLTVYYPQTLDMLRTCIQNDRTFGVISLKPDVAPIGTTAEIYEYWDGAPVPAIRMKAKGRQRFKLLRAFWQDYDKMSAHVKILPEITLSRPFVEERLISLDHLRTQPSDTEDVKKLEKIRKLDATVTPWPAWVLKQYDPQHLSLRLRKHLSFIESRGASVPHDPTDLSFWVAQNLVLDDDERMHLLHYNCAISRLQREIKYLEKERFFVCCKCQSFITKQSHMFPMSKEGPEGAYCNRGGVIYEIITLYRAQNLNLTIEQSTEYSWFPGYAWRIASCTKCDTHMGWKFTAVKEGLKPKSFWGLTRKNLKNKKQTWD